MPMNVLGVKIDPVTTQDALEILYGQLATAVTPYTVVTPNPEIITYAFNHPEYRLLLNTADLHLPDGQGLVWMSQGKIPERVTGIDTMIAILDYANGQNLSIGIVLAPDGLSSSQLVKKVMAEQYPNCKLSITYHMFEYGIPDIVFVALGFPWQEQWMMQHRETLVNTKLIMTVGGAVDFITKQQIRAPLFFRKIGLEWLWRLTKQPQRFQRIIVAIFIFPYLVVFKSKSFQTSSNE